MGDQSMTGMKAQLLGLVAFFRSLTSSTATTSFLDRARHLGESVLGTEADYNPDASLLTRAKQAGTVIAVVVIGIVALVGILVFGEVYQSLPSDGPLNNTSDEIVTGFGDAMGLVPIILLVLLASIVIGVVQRMRGGM